MKSSFKEGLTELNNSERPESCSIKDYDRFTQDAFIYGLCKSKTRRCDIVTARIRRGYRQVSTNCNVKETKCKLCSEEYKRTVVRYISESCVTAFQTT